MYTVDSGLMCMYVSSSISRTTSTSDEHSASNPSSQRHQIQIKYLEAHARVDSNMQKICLSMLENSNSTSQPCVGGVDYIADSLRTTALGYLATTWRHSGCEGRMAVYPLE